MIAEQQNCSLTQLVLTWVLGRGEHVIAIPGTANRHHLQENVSATEIVLNADAFTQLDNIINQKTVNGPRDNSSRNRYRTTPLKSN